MAKMRTDNRAYWFGEKWIKSLLTGVVIFGIIVAGGVVTVEAANSSNSYAEYQDFYYRKKEITPHSTTPTNWQECQANCHAEPLCVMFEFIPMSNGEMRCHRYENSLAYGPLGQHNAITGQLDPTTPSRPLAWLGTGYLDGGTSYVGKLTDVLVSRADCEAECNTAAPARSDGAQCASYEISTMFVADTCSAYDFAFFEPPDEPRAVGEGGRVGVRSDLNFSQTAIIGDNLNTRVAAADLPPAPPNIGGAIPAYTKVPYHVSMGTRRFMPFNGNMGEVVATLQECSIMCHRNATCKAFGWYRRGGEPMKCTLFDAVLFGKTRPGYSKYGIIDRSGPEGAVSSLLPAFPEAKDVGYRLFSYRSVASMNDCAKLCYDFHQPKICAAFFYSVPLSECQLFDAAVPCAFEGDASISSFPWDAANYHYGFINGRLSSSLLEDISCCYNISYTGHTPCRTISTTVESTSTTTAALPSAAAQKRQHGDVQIFWNKPGKIVQSVAPVEILVKQRSGQCAVACHARAWCVSFDYNEVSQECRLFEASVGANNLMANASTQYLISGGVYHSADGN